MIPHSGRLEAALLSSYPNRVTTLVDWSDDWTTWKPLRVISGTHTIDRTQQTRWACSGVFMPDYEVGEGRGQIVPYGARLRVRTRMDMLGFGSEILSSGVYSVTAAERLEGSITLTGASFETDCIDSTFPQARSFPSLPRLTLRQQAEKLITEAVSDATFQWDTTLNYGLPMPELTADADRWPVVDGPRSAPSIAGALGADAFCNSYGAFQFAPVPTLSGDPVWRVQRGETLITPQTTYDRDGVKNLVVVTGTPAAGGAVIGPAFAWDRRTTSHTYAGPDPLNHPELSGPFGVKPIRYDNPLITTLQQADIAARAQLSAYLGAHKVVQFDAAFNPFLEAGDLVEFQRTDGIFEKHLLDSVVVTWGSDKITCITRSPKEDLV